MNIVEILNKNRIEYGEKVAFIEKNEEINYQDFYKKVCQIARNLRERQIEKGAQILVLIPLSIDLYATLCAIWMVGAQAVMFDPSAGKEHIMKCLAEMPVSGFIGTRKSLLLKWMNSSIRKIKNTVSVEQLFKSVSVETDISICDAEEDMPALITFTSGSTGIPKAIVRTHGFLLKQHQVIRESMRYDQDDVDLAVLPVFTLVNLVEGITTVLPEDSLKDIETIDAKKLTEQILRYGVTRITASPKFLERISDYARVSGIHFEKLRSVNIGGGPIFLDTLEKIFQVVNQENVLLVYGSTEAEPIAELPAKDLSQGDIQKIQEGKGLLAGKIVDSILLKIIRSKPGDTISSDELESLIQPMGEPGEIIVTGEHVVKGYLNPEQNAVTKIADKQVWHRTGDLGYLDEEGRLWLLGRAGQELQIKGKVVYPFSIEGAIRGKYGTLSAIMKNEEEHILILEKSNEGQKIRAEYGELFDRIIEIDQIPMDRRHSSKVNYEKLRSVIK